jgi:hypothetical protein
VAEPLAIAEAFADKVATLDERPEANKIVTWAKLEMPEILNNLGDGLEIALQSQPLTIADGIRAAGRMLAWKKNIAGQTMSSERERQSSCLRCIFGPLPFRQVSRNSKCLNATVVSFAQTIYDERDFDGLPLLADALEEAGCTNTDILAHSRQSGAPIGRPLPRTRTVTDFSCQESFVGSTPCCVKASRRPCSGTMVGSE